MVVVSGVSVTLIVTRLTDHWLRERTRPVLAEQGIAPPPLGGSRPAGPPGNASPVNNAGPPGNAGPLAPQRGAQIAADTLSDVRKLGFVLTGVLAIVGSIASWFVAGRVVSPLRKATRTARDINRGNDLSRRISLAGPADEVKELADTLDSMFERLELNFAAQQAFVANASHELRTPITVMKTEVDVALDDPEPNIDDLRAALVTIDKTLNRSAALVQSMLTLSKSEFITNRVPVNLSETVRDAVHYTGVPDRFECAFASGFVTGDPVLITQMVGNLLENALKHGDSLESIKVTTSCAGGFCSVRVENGGDVIEPEVVPLLFERFRRRQRTGEGFGIGLAIVKAIAKAHGGTAEAQPRAGGGLIVTVSIPSR